MRSRTVLLLPVLLLLVTGCSTQKHPDFSAFQNVLYLSSFKAQIKASPIKHIELPTKLPFKARFVNIVPSVNGIGDIIPLPINVTDDKFREGISIVVTPDSQNTPPSVKHSLLGHPEVTHLSNGTKAIYGHNGSNAMLDWVKDGVEYTLSSSSLNEQQLIRIADSFR